MIRSSEGPGPDVQVEGQMKTAGLITNRIDKPSENHGQGEPHSVGIDTDAPHFAPGRSTAVGSNVTYRLGKLQEQELVRGVWLDCGCASGGYTKALTEGGAERAIGIDVDPRRVLGAEQEKNGSKGVLFSCATSEALPFAEHSFDGVLLNEVLEHVRDENLTLEEIFRVLRPGGHLALMSPNRYFPFEGHGMKLLGKVYYFPIPILPWLPSRLAVRFMRARNYWPGELKQLARRAGFEIVASRSILPVLEVYPWLPRPLIKWYRRAMPILEQVPFARRFGVSTLVLAKRPN